MRPTKSRTWFTWLTKTTAHAVGRPVAFLVAAAAVIVWALTGPLFGFSDTWQLVINTATTIVTFLMVFLIQSTQNRDAEAMQAKLDEIIRAAERDGAQADAARFGYLQVQFQALVDAGDERATVGNWMANDVPLRYRP